MWILRGDCVLEKIKCILSDKSTYRFLLVGLICTSLDFCIYVILLGRTNLILSKTISMSCSMLVNYFLNKFWSFSARHKKNQYELLRFAATQMANMFANVSVNAIIFSATQIKSLAFIIATGVAFCVNYVLQRFWVFTNKIN